MLDLRGFVSSLRVAVNRDQHATFAQLRIVKVEKKPVVNEELHVGKREVQDTKRISDQVRHEELRTEGDAKEELEKARDKTRKTA